MISAGPSILRMATFVNGSPFKPEDLAGSGFPVVRIRHLLDEDADCDMAEPPARPVWLADDDLVFSWSATLAVRRWNRGRALLNQHLYRVDVQPEIDARWFKHVLEVGIDRLRPFMHGSAMTHITQDMLRTVTTQVPSQEEQRAIADYLDAETARIDALIAKKQQLVQLVEARWGSFLDSMTNVGSSVQVRHVTSLRTSGPRGWSERVGNAGRPFVRSMNLTRGSIELKLDELALVDPPDSPESRRSEIRGGDSLVGITGANTGWIALANDSVTGGYVSQHVAVLRPRSVDSRWFAYCISSPRARDQLLGGQYGGTKTQLGLDDLAELSVSVPARAEQLVRVRALDTAYTRSQRLIAALRDQILLLAEHRQALITSAVTGQHRVQVSA